MINSLAPAFEAFMAIYAHLPVPVVTFISFLWLLVIIPWFINLVIKVK